jgi:4-hydroxybenzoate polyprenyltransferase
MKPKTFSVFSVDFLKAYWITLRPYLFFVSGASGLLGLAIIKDADIFSLKWSVIFLISFVSYGLGQALTDCTQLDTDSLSSPYRPLVKGVITPRQVALVSSFFLISGAILLFVFNKITLVLTAIMIFGVSTYTFFKRRFWGGPPWNSWIVGLLPLLTYTAEDASHSLVKIPEELMWLMGSVFFSYSIFVIVGYYKDISADRSSGYQTVVVRFGWKKSIFISLAATIGTLLCSFIAIYSYMANELSIPQIIAGLQWFFGILYLFYLHYQLYKMPEDENSAYVPIANSVRGFVLLHCGEASFMDHRLALFTLLFWSVFELFMKIRPERSQV